MADGAHDIHAHLNLSGEPLIPDLERSFRLRPPMDLLQYQDLTLEGLEYESAYSDYWNSTATDDGTLKLSLPTEPARGRRCAQPYVQDRLSMPSLCQWLRTPRSSPAITTTLVRAHLQR